MKSNVMTKQSNCGRYKYISVISRREVPMHIRVRVRLGTINIAGPLNQIKVYINRAIIYIGIETMVNTVRNDDMHDCMTQ